MGENEKRRRRSIRLRGYDYSRVGAYFVTICTQDRAHLFGEVRNGVMRLNDAGALVYEQWFALERMFSGLSVDDVVVMPNHIHGIIQIHGPVKAIRGATTDAPAGAPLVGAPAPQRAVGAPVSQRTVGAPVSQRTVGAPITVGRVVGAFKSCSTNGYIRGVRTMGWIPFRGRLWQRNYHEWILRDEAALTRVRRYINNNPWRWWLDRS